MPLQARLSRMRIDILPHCIVRDRVDQGGLSGSYGGLVFCPSRKFLVNEATLISDCIPKKTKKVKLNTTNTINERHQAGIHEGRRRNVRTRRAIVHCAEFRVERSGTWLSLPRLPNPILEKLAADMMGLFAGETTLRPAKGPPSGMHRMVSSGLEQREQLGKLV